MRFSNDWWAFWAGVWAVSLTAAAAIAGLIAWWFSTLAAANNDERTRNLELRVSEQQERAAKAELELAAVKKLQAPRHLPFHPFVDALKGKPKATAEIRYLSEDTEAYGTNACRYPQ